MKCGKLETLWLPYLDGKLSSQERALVEAHLAQCSACAEQMEGFRQVSQSLEIWQAPAASPWFEARLRQKVAEEAAPRGLFGWLLAPLTSFPVSATVGVAVLLLLAVLLISSGGIRRSPAPDLIVSDVQVDELLQVVEEGDLYVQLQAALQENSTDELLNFMAEVELLDEFEVLGELQKPVHGQWR